QAGHQTTINAARGGLCIAAGDGFIPPRGLVCGSETTADSILEDYCASDDIGVATNITLCPAGYVRLNGDAAEVSWAEFNASGKNQPLNADGSGALNVFEADVRFAAFKPTNFVKIAVGSTLPLGLTRHHQVITLTDMSDGFASVASGGSNKLYVGLLPGTSLGAPLRNATETSATWNADLSVLFFNGTTFTQDSGTFKLQVNFGGDTGNTLAIMGDDPSVATLGAFSLTNAKFTKNGVIYGTVAFANYGAGTITGLIGTAGAVGIFKSDNPSFTGNQYVGGFVAEPPADVTATGFKAKALQSNGTDTLIVLDSGAPDTANADTVNFIEGGAVGTGFEDATMKISLPINTGGGVAFAYGDSGTANNYHVGILADTNVGPALNNDVTGDWVGKIQAIVNGSDTTEQAITFNVNFGAKSFAIKDGTAP
ncbi:MAG: hypothetical protein K8953_09045, partial [Proteobacteria bacterium]|nr:hypothetical protein [Pseudomonadota bacterium]